MGVYRNFEKIFTHSVMYIIYTLIFSCATAFGEVLLPPLVSEPHIGFLSCRRTIFQFFSQSRRRCPSFQKLKSKLRIFLGYYFSNLNPFLWKKVADDTVVLNFASEGRRKFYVQLGDKIFKIRRCLPQFNSSARYKICQKSEFTK